MSRCGDRLRTIAARWLDRRTMAHVVDPAIADLQRQPSFGHYVAVLKVIALCASRETLMGSSSWTTDERRTLGRTLTWSGVLVTTLTAVTLLPFWRIVPRGPVNPGPLRFVYMLPGSLAVTLTLGATLGFMVALGGRAVSRRLAACALALSVAVSAASFANVGWLTPAANQAFRALLSGSSNLEPGIREFSMTELSEKIDQFSGPEFSRFGYLHAMSFNYYTRWAMVFGPVIFMVFALAVAVVVSERWVRLIVVILAFGSWWYVLNLPKMMPWNSGLSPFTAAWLGNLLVLGAAAALSLIALARTPSRVSLPA